MFQSVLQLECKCNEYPWGQPGSRSLAARLAAKTPSTGFQIQEGIHYSEMWMGTYPDLPSYLLSTGEDLQDVLKKHPEELLGARILRKFGEPVLPYLLKVLSIAKALPLQLHPDKSLAEQLHRDNPAEFPDPNHKPEMALALSEFEAFVGFKPLEEIEPLFQIHPLRTFLPSSGQSFDNQMLKAIVHSILSSPGELIATKVNELAKLPREAFGECGYITDLLPRLRKQYGESVGIGNGYMLKRLTIGQDPGTLVALFTMNYLKLNPGEAIYIPPDCIHAYLSGDIIECMARSNNMLTAGFCPVSERAVELFVAALSFQSQPKSKLSLPADPWDRAKNGKTALFAPPLSEFRLLALQMEQDQNEEWPALDGPAIMVVTTGSGRMSAAGENFELKEGFVFFIAHGIGVKLLAKTAIRAFVAFVE